MEKSFLKGCWLSFGEDIEGTFQEISKLTLPSFWRESPHIVNSPLFNSSELREIFALRAESLYNGELELAGQDTGYTTMMKLEQ